VKHRLTLSIPLSFSVFSSLLLKVLAALMPADPRRDRTALGLYSTDITYILDSLVAPRAHGALSTMYGRVLAFTISEHLVYRPLRALGAYIAQ
jgi:hypothetical protein